MPRGLHPKSLANLARGRAIALQRRRELRLDHVPPATRRRISAAGGQSRARSFMTDRERAILKQHGPQGLALFREGKRLGYNRAYQRWKAWGDSLYRRLQQPA